ncbi:MAG TPA: hypothetical protein VHT05_05135 [Candidatus Elarobacter sp.]|nr:hypothetical protein [Candidatus Elarobacter sp.]
MGEVRQLNPALEEDAGHPYALDVAGGLPLEPVQPPVDRRLGTSFGFRVGSIGCERQRLLARKLG